MNDGVNEADFRALAGEQRRLRELLDQLDARIAALRPPAPAVSVAKFIPPPVPGAPDLPPPLTVPPPVRSAPVVPPPPIPPVAAPASAPPPIPPPPPVPRVSLEERIGGTWLVRIGIVALLTGLALGVGWLIQNVVPRLGVLGKVGGLYLVAGGLTGAGFWLERRAKANPGLRNYARVLLGGGLAAGYFVTYAAGFLPGLRVIHNEWVAGTLLLAWTAFMAWTADRRDSQTLATFSLLLAYFTTAINPAAAFTLGSNALLTVAAIVLAQRHRWPVFSFAALAATYGAYAFWRLSGEVHPAVDPAHFWLETGFLGIYWSLFTVAAFAVPAATLPPRRRAAFLASNHGALFGLVSVWVSKVYPAHFWQWSLGFGLLLIVLGETRRFGLEAASAGVSRVLGIVLGTLGLVACFDHGWSLGLALAAESVVLLIAAEPPSVVGKTERDWVNRTQLFLSGFAGFLAFLVAGAEVDKYATANPFPHPLDVGVIANGAAVVGVLLFNAAWTRRRGRGGAEVFAGFALLTAYLVLRSQADPAYLATCLALAAVLLTVALAPALRIAAIAGFGLFYLLLAVGDFVGRHPWALPLPPWWETVAVAGAAVGLCHWWQRSDAFPWRKELRWLAQGTLALAAVLTLDAALRPAFTTVPWMAVGSALAIAAAGYGLATRSLALGAAGQTFLFTAALGLVAMMDGRRLVGNERWAALAPSLAAFAVVAAVKRFAPADTFQRHPAARFGAAAYEWLGVGLFAFWAIVFAPAEGRFAFLAVVGTGAMVAGIRFVERRWVWQGAALAVVGGLVFLEQSFGGFAARLEWWNVLGLLALAAGGQFARRSLPTAANVVPPGLSAALTFLAALGGWRWLSDNLSARVGGDWTLAAGWSAYAAALFGAGLALRERRFRWVGLGILGVTMARIFLVDFWHADSGHRILSLLAFSAVLLGLGFVYNRFGAKLREWM